MKDKASRRGGAPVDAATAAAWEHRLILRIRFRECSARGSLHRYPGHATKRRSSGVVRFAFKRALLLLTTCYCTCRVYMPVRQRHHAPCRPSTTARVCHGRTTSDGRRRARTGEPHSAATSGRSRQPLRHAGGFQRETHFVLIFGSLASSDETSARHTQPRTPVPAFPSAAPDCAVLAPLLHKVC